MMRKKEVRTDFSEKYIKWFSQLNKKDVAIAGGKGASLSEMYNHKFPVPPGFVVTSKAFSIFLEKENIKEDILEILKKINMEETEELEKASKHIRELIEGRQMPKELEEEILEAYHILSSDDIERGGISETALNILKNAQEPIFVSVRSSATAEDSSDASFAGQQESFLNVKGGDNLIEYIKRCFSSIYTPRSIYYRNKKGFQEKGVSMAVVVQKMVDSEESGVVFSKNPMDSSDDIVVEAVFGLGEGIVSGRIQPDNYIVSSDLKIKRIGISSKKIAIVRKGSGENAIVELSPAKSKAQVLSNGQILEIANYAIRLEDYYKKPQDIEFALEGGKIYIVQSRPITTLGIKKKSAEINGNVILEGLGASPGIGVGIVKVILSLSDLSKVKKGDVLVTKMTNPDMVVSMQKSTAIVTDEGGVTAHASIVSREMGIPCVVGTEKATSILKDGMKITVDGTNGKIYEGEVSETLKTEIKPVIKTKRTSIKVIIDLPDFAERAAESKIEEIGLCRLEGMITKSGKHPLFFEKHGELDEYSNLLKKDIEKIIEKFKSIWIRTSDVRTDEFNTLKEAPEREINPMLGLHGIRFSLKYPGILKAELSAVREVAEKYPSKNFGVMFPQIISMEEVEKAREYFDNIKTSNMEFGVMIETPAAVQIIDEICQKVDFISLGTNDLTQYTLAVDRGEEEIQHLYNETHPAVLSQIKKVIISCRKNKVQSSICGQAGSNKDMVEFLVKNGIDSISVNADAGYEISKFIAELEDSTSEQSFELDNKIEEQKEESDETDGKKEESDKTEEELRIPDEEWKKLTRKEKRKLRRKLLKKKKKMLEGESEFNDRKKFLDKENIQIPAEFEEEIENVREAGQEIIPEDKENFEEDENMKEDDIDFNSEKENLEDMGIYNPDEESDNNYQKRNYKFDEDNENIYSDVF